MTGPFDFYLLAWLAGIGSGQPFEVVRVSTQHRKCWDFVKISPMGAPA
jgi:hypothetical protein